VSFQKKQKNLADQEKETYLGHLIEEKKDKVALRLV
jgi:hypothetical protein